MGRILKRGLVARFNLAALSPTQPTAACTAFIKENRMKFVLAAGVFVPIMVVVCHFTPRI
jgi:hypothetical protein